VLGDGLACEKIDASERHEFIPVATDCAWIWQVQYKARAVLRIRQAGKTQAGRSSWAATTFWKE
jgi:hypothetical protein